MDFKSQLPDYNPSMLILHKHMDFEVKTNYLHITHYTRYTTHLSRDLERKRIASDGALTVTKSTFTHSLAYSVTVREGQENSFQLNF